MLTVIFLQSYICPESALRMLSTCSWVDFQQRVNEICMEFNPVPPIISTIETSKTLPSRLIDRRYVLESTSSSHDLHNIVIKLSRRQVALKGILPNGYSIGKSTTDGNYLYSAISVCLFGISGRKEALYFRLLSVIHATHHMQKYVLRVVPTRPRTFF